MFERMPRGEDAHVDAMEDALEDMAVPAIAVPHQRMYILIADCLEALALARRDHQAAIDDLADALY